MKIIDKASIIHLVSKMWEREMENNNITLKCRERRQILHTIIVNVSREEEQ